MRSFTLSFKGFVTLSILLKGLVTFTISFKRLVTCGAVEGAHVAPLRVVEVWIRAPLLST